MEQAQLFKRLHAMALDELKDFLDFGEPVSQAIYKLDVAARTRQILNSIQLEDMWQELDENTQLFNLYLSMRLSPESLSGCLDFREDMNSLEWRFVFPKINDIPEDQRPTCYGDFLAKLLRVDIIDIQEYDIEIACEFLDLVYDFTPLKNPPPRIN
jgi:hypothetical protein